MHLKDTTKKSSSLANSDVDIPQFICASLCTTNTKTNTIRLLNHPYNPGPYSANAKLLMNLCKRSINYASITSTACRSHDHTPRLLVPLFCRHFTLHRTVGRTSAAAWSWMGLGPSMRGSCRALRPWRGDATPWRDALLL